MFNNFIFQVTFCNRNSDGTNYFWTTYEMFCYLSLQKVFFPTLKFAKRPQIQFQRKQLNFTQTNIFPETASKAISQHCECKSIDTDQLDTLPFPITFLELLGVEIDITSLNFGKFSQSPILHYQFSSWMEKTMTKTIHCLWKKRFVLQQYGLCGNFTLNFVQIISDGRLLYSYISNHDIFRKICNLKIIATKLIFQS